MTVFGHSSGGSSKQVVPFDYETEVSQRLLESAHSNDNVSAFECIADPLVDVNYVGAVWLNVRKAELVCRDESPIQIRFELEKFKTDVTPLFLAAHNGNVALVNKLLVSLLNLFHYFNFFRCFLNFFIFDEKFACDYDFSLSLFQKKKKKRAYH